MFIEIQTDNHLDQTNQLREMVQATFEQALDRFADQITHLEVHLTDENSHKGGDHDHRCAVEVRLEGHQPLGVSHEAPSTDLAIDGAADKIVSVVEHTLGKLHDRRMK